MNGMIAAWQSLSTTNKIISVAAVVATVLLLGVFTRQAAKPEMSLLYSGLDPAAAGEVIAELDGLGVAYEVRGETIYTDAGKRDMLRLELAREGLPRQGAAGYELLDNLNSFAMTSEMFNTAYWRAKEGELARTLSTMPGVRAARVHIGASQQTSFTKSQSATSASVTVTTTSGIEAKEAKAIQYLTALAVAGLSPNDVAVIDTAYGLVAGPGELSDGGALADEKGRAEKIEQTVRSLLEAYVGVGNARVSVTMDINRETQAVSERVIDPDSRVVTSRTASEISSNSSGSDPYVSVGSNLSEDGETAEARSDTRRTETTEQAEYDMSVVQRETQKLPGGVTKMTVAVLLNERSIIGEDGAPTTQARDAAELANLRELVAAAAGVDEARGDVLTVKSLPFTPVAEIDRPVPPTRMENFLDRYLWSAIQVAVLAVVVLILGLFVIRPLLTQREETGAEALKLAEAAGKDVPTLTAAEREEEHEDPVDLLKVLARDKPDDAAQLLTAWLEKDTTAQSGPQPGSEAA